MIICINCRREMRCVETGAIIHFGGGENVCMVDVFECSECGTRVSAGAGDTFYLSPKLLEEARGNGAIIELKP